MHALSRSYRQKGFCHDGRSVWNIHGWSNCEREVGESTPWRSRVEIGRLAEPYKTQLRRETHWESEFFLEDETD